MKNNMGIHTWFYRHVPRTQEEAKQSCLKKFKDWLTYAKDKSLVERMIRMVEKDLCQKAVWNWQDEDITRFIDGKYYVSDMEYHDVFRVAWKHQDVVLFSLEETLAFIKKEGLEMSEFGERKLKEFWDKYPDGRIDFGQK